MHGVQLLALGALFCLLFAPGIAFLHHTVIVGDFDGMAERRGRSLSQALRPDETQRDHQERDQGGGGVENSGVHAWLYRQFAAVTPASFIGRNSGTPAPCVVRMSHYIGAIGLLPLEGQPEIQSAGMGTIKT